MVFNLLVFMPSYASSPEAQVSSSYIYPLFEDQV